MEIWTNNLPEVMEFKMLLRTSFSVDWERSFSLVIICPSINKKGHFTSYLFIQ